MSTANKNYPLIKETDSNGQPLNAYDQLVTESNNFRRAVDKDINELEQDVILAHEKINAISGNNNSLSTIFANMNNNSKATVYGYSADTERGHPLTVTVANYVANITKINNTYGQCVFTTRNDAYLGGWNPTTNQFNWRRVPQ